MYKMILQTMKKVLLLTAVILAITQCGKQSFSPEALVGTYYQAFDDSDFDKIREVISDSLTIVEGDYITLYTNESFYEQFRWDSIFQTSYQIKELESNADEQVIVTVSSSSVRYRFLKNDPLTCQFKISIEDKKIKKIEAMDCLEADWAVWEGERDSLVQWTQLHHPELDGFIHDLSMQGAMNYLKAIELYLARH